MRPKNQSNQALRDGHSDSIDQQNSFKMKHLNVDCKVLCEALTSSPRQRSSAGIRFRMRCARLGEEGLR
jgi:hypothetical protein